MNLSNKLNSILEEYSKGDKKSAYKKYKKIYIQNNKNIKMRFNLAVMEQELGLLNEAESNYKYIIANNSDIKSKINLYNLYISKGLLEDALNLINSIQAEKSNLMQVNQDKAYLLFKLKKYTDAINESNKILKTDEKNINVLNILGLCYFSIKNYDDANKIFLKALSFDNNDIKVLNSLGRLNHELRKSKEAELYFLRALELNNYVFETLNNVAGFYLEEAEYLKAMNFYKEAEILKPKNSVLLNNISKAYLNIGEINNAEKYCRDAILINKENDEFQKNLSLILLKKYDFKNAWLYFDGRLGLSDFIDKNSALSLIKYKIPDNRKLNKNAKILVIREQGIGDEILYGTMYHDLLSHFTNAIIECDDRLIPLFRNSFNESDSNKFVKLGQYSSNKEDINEFDYVIYAGSLGRYFRQNIESFPNKPYLKKILDYRDFELEKIFGDHTGLKIGISWKSFNNRYAVEKSLKIEDFKNIFEIEGATIFNLQYGDTENELNNFLNENDYNIITLKDLDLFNNFSGLANLLSNLDFFITVSNSTAHLASALGVTTILIKPVNHASFHYWNYDNRKTPWYSTVDIISKENLNDKRFIKKLIKS